MDIINKFFINDNLINYNLFYHTDLCKNSFIENINYFNKVKSYNKIKSMPKGAHLHLHFLYVAKISNFIKHIKKNNIYKNIFYTVKYNNKKIDYKYSYYLFIIKDKHLKKSYNYNDILSNKNNKNITLKHISTLKNLDNIYCINKNICFKNFFYLTLFMKRTRYFFKHVDIFKLYVKYILDLFYKDNLFYVELRGSLSTLYDNILGKLEYYNDYTINRKQRKKIYNMKGGNKRMKKTFDTTKIFIKCIIEWKLDRFKKINFTNNYVKKLIQINEALNKNNINDKICLNIMADKSILKEKNEEVIKITLMNIRFIIGEQKGSFYTTDINSNLDKTISSYKNINKKINYNFFVGYDLYGKEHESYTILDYLKILEKIKKESPEIKPILHAGETNYSHIDTDPNLLGVIKINSYRIGHGFNIYKYDNLIKLASKQYKNKIPIECCPISNYVLNFITDLRLHPMLNLYKNKKFKICINTDIQGLLGYEEMTYDLLYIIFSWNLNITDIYNLLYNSISMSCLNNNEKHVYNSAFKIMWKKWIKNFNKY